MTGFDHQRDDGGELAAKRRADDGAQAQEAKEPFGLARIENVGGHQPRLGYQDDAEQTDPDVQDIQHPAKVELQEPPDDDEAGKRNARGPINRHLQRGPDCDPRIQVSQQSATHGDQDVEERQAVNLELIQKQRPRYGLQNIVGKKHKHHVQRHQKSPRVFTRANIIHALPKESHPAHRST